MKKNRQDILKKYSFLKWVSIYIKRRLVLGAVFLFLITISVQTAFLAYSYKERSEQFETLGEIIASELRNNNISAIQKTALLAMRNLNSNWIALLNMKGEKIWAFPKLNGTINKPLYTQLKTPIAAIDGNLKLVASVPLFPNQTLFASLSLSLVLFIIILLWAIGGAVKRLSKDISIELKKLISLDKEISIQELEKVRIQINELREKDRVHAQTLSKRSELTAIGQMSSHIAHDMRSPLSALKGYVKTPTLSDEPEIKEYQAAAQRSVDKLLHMADDLVDYAKASKIDKSQQDFNKLISNELIAGAKKIAKENGIEVRYENAGNIIANIDAYRIERALVNLINNAIDAVDRGGEVVVKAKVECDRDLVITITDNGKGIAAEDIPHIFDSFFTKGKKSGTGLGLSYCKQVIEAHGGTIDVESEVRKGSKFTIRIPDCVIKFKAESRATKNDPEIKCKGKRFILIDDDIDIRLRWRKIVEDNGGTVIGEADSLEGMTGNGGMDYSSVDIAIVDFNFEGSSKTGIDVINYLRTKGIKEIHMCTGFFDNDDVRKAALAAGADSVIPKEIG